jgi:hypothetical protein
MAVMGGQNSNPNASHRQTNVMLWLRRSRTEPQAGACYCVRICAPFPCSFAAFLACAR